jgi:hypothetical protein
MQTVTQLRELAEVERNTGHRQKFLEIQKQIEVVMQKEVLAKHMQYLANAKKEFKVGLYIPEIRASVKDIQHDCGTEKGWIEILLSNDKKLSPRELRAKIQDAKEEKAAQDYFDKLKFSDQSKSLCIGGADYDTLDMLIKVMGLDLPDSEEIDEAIMYNPSEVYGYTLKEAKEDGYTDEEAEQKAQEAEDKERSEEFEKYLEAILRTINYLLEFHDLELVSLNSRYWLIAKTSWHIVADKVAATITGYGSFEYNSGTELRDVGPYKNYCKAAISHLHWLKYYPEVYGVSGYRRIYER